MQNLLLRRLAWIALAAPLTLPTLGPNLRGVQDPRPVPMQDSPTVTVRGDFDVTLAPLAPDEAWGGFGRLSIDKRFRGDLDGTSKGVMMAARTAVEGSAGYVALERVTATLAGRSGSFALQHSGTLARGAASLQVAVVPDSGTGGLEGLAGSMEIEVDERGHHYVLHYTLP